MRWLAPIFLAALAGQAEATPVEVPSGISVELIEAFWDESMGLSLRLRFLAPMIGETGFARVESDFVHLCQTLALPMIAEVGRQADLIIISYSDRNVPHGQTDPEAVQFFEAFRPVEATCVWEAF
jgi:hypothetical protein